MRQDASPNPSPTGAHGPRADVWGINLEKQRVAVVTDWGYTVADIRRGELKPHDIVAGEFNQLGEKDWRNLNTGVAVSVNVTHVQGTRIGADALLYRR